MNDRIPSVGYAEKEMKQFIVSYTIEWERLSMRNYAKD